jgi:predicted Zn-dependent protease
MDPMKKPLDEAQARATVKLVLDAVDAADVRIGINASDGGYLRWAVNGATTAGDVTDANVAITCAVGNKHATANVHGLEPSLVVAAARRALEMAKLAPDDPEYMPSLGPSAVKPVSIAWSDEPVGADERAAIAADAIALAKKNTLVGAGFLQSWRWSEVVATRAGFFGIHHGTSIDMTTTARTGDGGGSGWAATGGVGLKDLDPKGAAETACDKALRSKGARPLEPGKYAVVLEPAAVAGLSAQLGWSMDARAADEGHSPFTKKGGGQRLGEKLLGELTLRADPWSPVMPSAPFDFQGMPRTPVTFVDNGVIKKLHNSRYWAKKMKRPADAYYDAYIPTGPKPQTMAELVGGLERGLLITRFWYIRMVDPQTLTMTGLTRDGVFLVENGKITAPVNNFRFNQSVLAMFADADGYSQTVRSAFEDGGNVAAPGLRVKSFNMASKSDAV